MSFQFHKNWPNKPEMPNVKFWVCNQWKNNCFGTYPNFEFEGFTFTYGTIFCNAIEHTCLTLTLFNFAFVLRIRKE